jgi:hypothetical protein
MLTGIKRKALIELVGEETASQLMDSLAGREKSAQSAGTSYKDFGNASDINELVDALLSNETLKDAITEKCTPGTNDGNPKFPSSSRKAPMRNNAEDDDMDEDEDEDDEDMEMGSESLLTDDEMEAIADRVAERLMSRMDEMKAMMDGLDSELKMRGYQRKSRDDDELVSTLKDYTSTQETFAEAMVDTLEEISTRLKAMEESVGIGYSPSQSLSNIVGGAPQFKSFGNQYINSAEEQSAYDFWFKSQQ